MSLSIYHKIISPLHSKSVRKKKSRLNLDSELSKCISVLKEFDKNISKYLDEYENSEFKKEFNKKTQEIKNQLRYTETTSDFDCRLMYLIIRTFRPTLMVETGVLYGAFTAHILEAMNKNNKGFLYSIDLPFTEKQGYLVTDKSRWELIKGDTTKQLPSLLNKLQKIDIFHHDSGHTPALMRFEYENAVRCSSIIMSHDVIGSIYLQSPFEKFVKKFGLKYYIFRNLGLAFNKS